MSTSLWMAAVRNNGNFYPVNVSSDKENVEMDARMCTRISISRADRGTVQLFFSEQYQAALSKVRALFNLTESLPQDLLAVS